MEQQVKLLRRISIVLSILGILVSAYLTWTHFANTSVQCIGGSHGCDDVQQSVYSSIAGIPVALLGLFGYIAILGLLLIETKQGLLANNAPLLLFGCTLAGVAYSIYLTYLELFVIHAICQWCVASAVIMAGLFGISTYRVIKTTQE
jgi:uncharacterized membrane protein